jgi:hypothetical protein
LAADGRTRVASRAAAAAKAGRASGQAAVSTHAEFVGILPEAWSADGETLAFSVRLSIIAPHRMQSKPSSSSLARSSCAMPSVCGPGV